MTLADLVVKAMKEKGVDIQELLPDVERIPTGLAEVDYITGGGFPVGLLSILWGAENTGKSTLALLAAANVSRNAGVLWINAEGSFSRQYAESLGVNMDNVVVYTPTSAPAEQVMSYIIWMLNVDTNGRVLDFSDNGDTLIKLVVIDSLNALPSQRDLEGDMSDKDLGNRAKLFTKFQRLATTHLLKRRAAMIAISQMRQKVGAVYGNPNTMSGGNALRHWSSLTLEFLASKQIAVPRVTPEIAADVPGLEDKIGMTKVITQREIRVRVKKTRVFGTISGHEAKITLTMLPKPFVDPIPQLISVAMSMGIITDKNGKFPRGGAKLFFGDTELGVGSKQATEFVRGDEDVLVELYEKVYSKMRGEHGREEKARTDTEDS